jgi:hypothetical protein
MMRAMARREDVEERVMEALRAAHEPVREAVLYERVRAHGVQVDPDGFLAVLERLATLGHLRVAVDHELPARDPEPFQPRYYHPVR